jgi:hypothetical protein
MTTNRPRNRAKPYPALSEEGVSRTEAAMRRCLERPETKGTVNMCPEGGSLAEPFRAGEEAEARPGTSTALYTPRFLAR